MDLSLISAYVIGFIMQAGVFWVFRQLWLATWKPERAKESWKLIVQTNTGQLFYPLFKWFSPIACIVAVMGMIAALLGITALLLNGV